MTLEELRVIIDAQTKPFRDEMAKMQKQLDSVTSHVEKKINKIKTFFKGLGKVVGIASLISSLVLFGKNSLNTARTVEAATQQINRLLGENSTSFKKWVENNALSYNMAKADAISYGATYSNLLSSFLGSTSDIEIGTESLLKASSIIASNTGRTMADVMDRIRSGILGNTEAIEDLGINVNVAMLESTEAFKRFAGNKSWNQLDFQTQQQIRLMAILEQTTKKFGDSVALNTTSALLQLGAIVKDISLNIGNALLPVFNAVIPVLTTVALKIREVTAVFATFMSALFGKSIDTSTSAISNGASVLGDYSDAMNEASGAAKKMKGSLAGFDELNVISSPSSGGSGSESGGASSNLFSNSAFAEEPDTSGIDKMMNKVNDFKKFLSTNKPIILSLLAGIVSGFIVFNGITLAPGIILGIKSAIGVLTGWQLSITQTIQCLLGMTTPVMGVIALVSLVVAAITYLWNTSDDFRNKVIDAIYNLIDTLETFYNNFIKPIFDEIVRICLSVWKNGLEPLWNAWVDCVELIISVVLDLWNWVSPYLNDFLELLGPIWSGVLYGAGGIVADIFTWILNAITFAIDMASGILQGFLVSVSDIVGEIQLIFEGIMVFLEGVFTGNWEKVWYGLRNIISGAFQSLAGIVKGPINAVIGIVNGAISSINRIGFTVPNWVPVIGGNRYSVNVPKLQYLAEGGIASRATLGVFGEAGTEAILPLKRNTQGIEMIANKLLENMPVNSGGGTYLIQLVLEDGTILAKKIIKNIKDYEIVTGKPAF